MGGASKYGPTSCSLPGELASVQAHEILTLPSATFRNAQSCSTADSPLEIQFTDPELESREVLSLFLDILTFRGEDVGMCLCLETSISLIAFLDKCECGPVTEGFRLRLIRDVTENDCYSEAIFVLGAVLDDDRLCSAALLNEERFRIDRKLSKHFGITDIPLEALDSVPQVYLRALAEATPACDGKPCECFYETAHQRSRKFFNELWNLKDKLQDDRDRKRRLRMVNEALSVRKRQRL